MSHCLTDWYDRAGQWNPVDPIWRHPEGGGTIYVGNQTAASSLPLLRSHGITRVVNCTIGASQIPNFHEEEGHIQYYRFSVSLLACCLAHSPLLLACWAKDNKAPDNTPSVLCSTVHRR